MSADNPNQRLPDLRDQLARFNAERSELLRGRPIDTAEDRIPIPRSGVGGDVE
jgi:hypothetical protein